LLVRTLTKYVGLGRRAYSNLTVPEDVRRLRRPVAPRALGVPGADPN
jgi:hypothetical protein